MSDKTKNVEENNNTMNRIPNLDNETPAKLRKSPKNGGLRLGETLAEGQARLTATAVEATIPAAEKVLETARGIEKVAQEGRDKVAADYAEFVEVAGNAETLEATKETDDFDESVYEEHGKLAGKLDVAETQLAEKTKQRETAQKALTGAKSARTRSANKAIKAESAFRARVGWNSLETGFRRVQPGKKVRRG